MIVMHFHHVRGVSVSLHGVDPRNASAVVDAWIMGTQERFTIATPSGHTVWERHEIAGITVTR